MITFNDIYEASRKERYSENLQPLSENFIADVAEYLKEKKEMTSKKEDVFSDVIDKTKKQIENEFNQKIANANENKVSKKELNEIAKLKDDKQNLLDARRVQLKT